MDNSATGKIEQAHLPQPTAAPDPVSNRGVNRQQPKRRKHHHGGKANAFRKTADDQRRGNNRKGHLEHDKHRLGNVATESVLADARQQRFTQPANKAIAFTEGHTIGDGKPEQRGHTGNTETLHQHAENILTSNQATVKQRQPRQRHKQYQGRRGQNPCGIRATQAIGMARPCSQRTKKRYKSGRKS